MLSFATFHKDQKPWLCNKLKKEYKLQNSNLKKNQFKKRKKGKIHSHWKAKGMVPRSFK